MIIDPVLHSMITLYEIMNLKSWFTGMLFIKWKTMLI